LHFPQRFATLWLGLHSLETDNAALNPGVCYLSAPIDTLQLCPEQFRHFDRLALRKEGEMNGFVFDTTDDRGRASAGSKPSDHIFGMAGELHFPFMHPADYKQCVCVVHVRNYRSGRASHSASLAVLECDHRRRHRHSRSQRSPRGLDGAFFRLVVGSDVATLTVSFPSSFLIQICEGEVRPFANGKNRLELTTSSTTSIRRHRSQRTSPSAGPIGWSQQLR